MNNTLRLPEQNLVMLVGRLTRDPDVRFTQKGQAWCKFDMAVNRRFKDTSSGEWKDDTTFVPVVVWGPAAERCKDRLFKGSPVHVEGRLAQNDWVDKNGQKHRTLQVISRRLQFLASAGAGEASSASADAGSRAQAPEADFPAADDMSDVPF